MSPGSRLPRGRRRDVDARGRHHGGRRRRRLLRWPQLGVRQPMTNLLTIYLANIQRCQPLFAKLFLLNSLCFPSFHNSRLSNWKLVFFFTLTMMQKNFSLRKSTNMLSLRNSDNQLRSLLCQCRDENQVAVDLSQVFFPFF